MSKIQTIFLLMVFLLVMVLINILLVNPLKETFKGIDMSPMGANLNNVSDSIFPSYMVKSDDQPLHFSFSLN